MNYTHNIIVFLWLVPVLGFIVLPSMWSIYGMLYRAFERSRLTDINGYIALNDRDVVTGEDENRSRPRVHVEGREACIAEECVCSRATVSDFSRHGICLKDVPQKKHLAASSFRLVFRTRQQDYMVIARPVWKRLTGKGYIIGAEIDRIPEAWKNFVTGLTGSLDPGKV